MSINIQLGPLGFIDMICGAKLAVLYNPDFNYCTSSSSHRTYFIFYFSKFNKYFNGVLLLYFD